MNFDGRNWLPVEPREPSQVIVGHVIGLRTRECSHYTLFRERDGTLILRIEEKAADGTTLSDTWLEYIGE